MSVQVEWMVQTLLPDYKENGSHRDQYIISHEDIQISTMKYYVLVLACTFINQHYLNDTI